MKKSVSVYILKAFTIYHYVKNPLSILCPQYYNSYRYSKIRLFSFTGLGLANDKLPKVAQIMTFPWQLFFKFLRWLG